MMRDMYLLQVKKPSESNGEWDLMNVVETILAEVDFCRGYELGTRLSDASKIAVGSRPVPPHLRV